jgi:hypothetical protein
MTERIITTFEDDQDHILYGLDAWIEYLSDKHLPARASSIKRSNKGPSRRLLHTLKVLKKLTSQYGKPLR